MERWNYIEILDHEPSSVNLRRLKRGGALLINHDMMDQVGVIEEVSIDTADRKGRAIVRFGKSAKAEEIFRDVLDGIRSNVSVGYEIDDVVLEKEEKNGLSTYRVKRWTPFEISFVSVPADIEVGVGRNIEGGKPKEERQMEKCTVCGADMAGGKCPACEAKGAQKREADVLTTVTATAQKQTVEQMEKDRIHGIRTLCKMNKLDERFETMWIGQGSTLNQVADDLVNILEERGKTNPQPASKLGLSVKETQEFSLVRAIRASADQNWNNAPYELECSRAVAQKLNKVVDPKRFFVPFEVLERQYPAMARINPMTGRRDLTVATAGAGGYLVATENVGFIEMLRNRAVCFALGARRLSGLVGSVTVPRQSAAATAIWLANEASTVTESQQTFVQMALSPKNVGAYTEISRQLLLQSSPAVEGIVTDDLAQQVALAADLGALEGTAASGQPAGLAGTSGVGSVTGTSLAYAGIIEFQTDVASSNVRPVRGGYLTTPTIAGLIMARNKVTNDWSPLWEGNVWEGTVSGFPGMTTNAITAASMIFGDWQEMVIGEWGVLELEVNPYANFQAGIIGVRAIYSMDVGIRRPFAFSRATSIT